METCCTNLEQKKRGCEWIVSISMMEDWKEKFFSIEIKERKLKILKKLNQCFLDVL